MSKPTTVPIREIPPGMPFLHPGQEEAHIHLGDGDVCSPSRTHRFTHALDFEVIPLSTSLHSRSFGGFNQAELLTLSEQMLVDVNPRHIREPEKRQGDCALVLHALAKQFSNTDQPNTSKKTARK
jgi:hypothetical protein